MFILAKAEKAVKFKEEVQVLDFESDDVTIDEVIFLLCLIINRFSSFPVIVKKRCFRSLIVNTNMVNVFMSDFILLIC